MAITILIARQMPRATPSPGRLDPSGVPDYNATVEVVGARCLVAVPDSKQAAVD